MQLPAVVEVGGLLLAQWAKRSSSASSSTKCPFSLPTDECEKSTLLPEIALGGLLAARMDLIHSQLTQRGFLLGSCVVCDNDDEAGDFHLSVGLSPTLITKLACSCNLPLVPHNVYDVKQRLFLAQEALKIIDRCGIKYKSHCLLHHRHSLHKVVSNRSINDINSYFGGSIAIFFTWLKFLTVSLTLPSYIGLFVFAYQVYSGIEDDWYTPLYCCSVIVWNVVFVKFWRQHVSVSKFAWGQHDQLLTLDEPMRSTSKTQSGVNGHVSSQIAIAMRLLRYWMWGGILCLLFIATIPLLGFGYLKAMSCPEEFPEYLLIGINQLIENVSFNALSLNKNYLGLLLYCAFSVIVEKIGRFGICPFVIRHIFEKENINTNECKMAAVYADVAYMIVSRFTILLYLCLWEHNVSQARALLSIKLIFDQYEIMHSATLQEKKLHTFRIPKPTSMHKKYGTKHIRNDEESTSQKRLSAANRLFRTVSNDVDPALIPSQHATSPQSQDTERSVSDEASDFSTADTDSTATTKKRKKVHLKNFSRAFEKISKMVTGYHEPLSSRSDAYGGPSPQPQSSPKPFHKRFLPPKQSGSVDSDDEVEHDRVKSKCEEWKPKKNLEVLPLHDNMLLEDVYAPELHIEMGHTSKIYLFGVVAIFSGIYPLAPLIVIAQCTAIYTQDLTSIYSSQRPLLVYMRNVEKIFEFLKEWLLFVETLCFISIVVNCYLAFVVSPHGHLYIPDVIFGTDATGAIWFTVAVEHFCLLVYILFNLLVADVPAWVMKGVEDAKAKENLKKVGERQLLYEFQNPTNTSKIDLEKISLLKRTLNIQDSECVATDIQSIAATKIATLYSSCGWALNPFIFLGLTVVPTVLHYFYEPLYHYSIPALFIFAYYVHSLHERRVKTAVMGMIADPQILRLLVKDLPDWVKESDRHQCEWMNVVAQQCMHMCQIFEIKLQAKLNETFDRIKPAFVTGMVMEMISFGTIPPNILSVKVLPAIPGSRTITADVEFSYSGNFRMLINVGLLGQSMKLDFYDLRLCGEARVQLEPSNLSPDVAAKQQNFKPFSKANICFMKKPHVDISFSLGETDGKKMKSEARGFEANLGQTVKQMIATKALYPKSIQINLDKSTSTGESYSIANPMGVLQVQILSGTNLEIGDITTSDPFVEVRYADEIEKTAVVFKTLNPVWNTEIFEFLVFNDDMTGVQLIVYDYDLTSSPDFLGNASFDFSLEHSGEVQQLNLPLKGVSTGELQLAVTYYRLKETEVKKKNVDDVLGSLPQDIIVGDIINPDFALPLVDSSTEYKEMKHFQTSKAYKKKRMSLLGGLLKNISPGESGVVGQSSILGVLMISRIACKDLKPPSGGRGIALSAFCPYLQFSVNGLKRLTKSSRGSLNPSYFDEYKAFILRDDDSHSVDNLHLVIKLKSRKTLQKDVTIATVTFLVKHILENVGQEIYIDQPFVNADGKEEGRLQANMKIISSKL